MHNFAEPILEENLKTFQLSTASPTLRLQLLFYFAARVFQKLQILLPLITAGYTVHMKSVLMRLSILQ
jgi:hypothetical protein